MNVYIIWCSNGYGNRAVVAVVSSLSKANEMCNQLKCNQERYDNDYYYTEHEVK